MQRRTRRRWRDYRTAAGTRPVKEFLDGLSDPDAAVVAHGERATYRVLFAQEGRRGQVLLALEAFSKKTRRTPPQMIDLAERRLRDWRRRGMGR
jgi:phage-related protein